MIAIVEPGSLGGYIEAVSSKSMAHRLLILAALAPEDCEVSYNASSQDIEATVRCLDILRAQACVSATAVQSEPATLDCNESGSTLRFLLPVVCAMGLSARLIRRGRLADRPLHPLDDELRAHGATVEENGTDVLVAGTLRGGRFVLPGNVSSQYASGLLMAASTMREPVEVLVRKPVESRPYLQLTIEALGQFGQDVECSTIEVDGIPYERFLVRVPGLSAPKSCVVEGDWSNAAFWLAAGAMESEGVTVGGLNMLSSQGDRSVLAALAALGARIARRGDAARATHDAERCLSVDVSSIPDLVPPLAAVAATTPGTSRLQNAGRLRMKESDRLASVSDAITSLHGQAHIEGDDLVIDGVDQLSGGTVCTANDHRIAMMSAIMATHATGQVFIHGAECVAKSYPTFWDDYARLGGKVSLIEESEA